MVLTPLRPGALLAVLLGAASVGCLHRPPLARFDQPTPMTVVVLLDDKSGIELDGLPPELGAAIEHELGKRNLTDTPAGPEALAPLRQNRSSRSRLDLLAKALGPHRELLLVEVKSNFFGQFEGGYKWNVDAQITVAESDAQDQATSSSAGVPAFLDQESQGSHEALAQAAAGLAEHVGSAIDDHFAGRMPAAPTAAVVTPP